MPAQDTVTNRGKLEILQGVADLDNAAVVIKCAVILDTGAGEAVGLSVATVQDLNFLSELDAVTGISIHGLFGDATRITVGTKTVTEDDTNNWALFDAADIVFVAAAGVTARGVAFYRNVTTDADSPLYSVHTTGFPQPMDGGLTIATPNGIIRGT